MPPKKTTTDDVLPAEVSRIDELGLTFDPDPNFARGDCRDAMLNVLRTTSDWSKFSEQQQRDINAAIDQASETIIAKLVKALAAEGRETVPAKLDKLTVDGGIKLNLSAEFTHDYLVLLGDLQGKHVIITMADVQAHDHERAPAKVDPDQPQLPTGEPGSEDLATAGDDDQSGGEIVKDVVIKDSIRVNLKTSMVQQLPEGADADDDSAWADVRDATPDELAAERERTADFVDV